MSGAVEISVACDTWLAACPEAAAIAEIAAQAALTYAGRVSSLPAPGLVLGLRLTDDAEQRQLNHAYRGRNASTNVLSFALAEEASAGPPGAPLLLGDVVLAFETVRREAAEQGKSLPDHLRHLVVHGVLHLFGYDHDDEEEAEAMEAAEIEILRELGVPDPYREIM